MRKFFKFSLLFTIAGQLVAYGNFFDDALALDTSSVYEDEVCEALMRSDAIPSSHYEDGNEDAYLEGYIQALLNAHYYEFDVLVSVTDEHVYLYNLPKNKLTANSIISFVEDLPQVKSVEVQEHFPSERLEELEKREVQPQVNGIWFPQTTVLYQPMVANPREAIYSAVYRIGDNVMGHDAVAVALGDNFPIFRWRNVLRWKGDLQIDIQSAIWSVFKMWINKDNGEISELVNTDYLLGFPLSYAFDKWAFRLRIYHVSSHLGDEYMVNHPNVVRKNPSMEAIDFFVSFQVNESLRLYIGPGWVLHSDRTYHLDPLYVEWGGEARIWGRKSFYHQLYGTAFLAVYMRNWQVVHWKLDGTYMAGYEWSKLQGAGRKMRLFVNYHHGYSEGQFFKDSTSYWGFGLSWGF